jgi:hypothetical protein
MNDPRFDVNHPDHQSVRATTQFSEYLAELKESDFEKYLQVLMSGESLLGWSSDGTFYEND